MDQIPRTDDLVERIMGAIYISTLDLCKGYWQVPLSSETLCLLFQFTVLPFGLNAAPASFLRLMDKVLSGTETRVLCSGTLDCIAIYSIGWKDNLYQVQHLLDKKKPKAKCLLGSVGWYGPFFREFSAFVIPPHQPLFRD